MMTSKISPEIKSHSPIISSSSDFSHNFTSMDTIDNPQLDSMLHLKIPQMSHISKREMKNIVFAIFIWPQNPVS